MNIPNGFDKKTALRCCDLIDILYHDMYEDWNLAGRPEEDDGFQWTCDDSRNFKKFGNPLWSQAKTYRRRPGPRRRYTWKYEWSPMAISALDNDNTLYLGIRGTTSNVEWGSNFRFHSRPINLDEPEFCVHDGFGDVYESFESRIPQELNQMLQNSSSNISRLVITGHSLGAAIATLAAADILLNAQINVPKIETYVIASPRSVNPAYANAINEVAETFYRIENTHDTVVKLPPQTIGPFSYEHIGQALELDVDLGGFASNHLIAGYRSLLQTQLPLT